MLGKLYLGEVKKLIRPVSLIIVCVLFVLFFILFAVAYGQNIEDLKISMDNNGQVTVGELFGKKYIQSVNADNVDFLIEEAEKDYAESKQNKADEQDYAKKALVTYLKYVKANNLYGQDIYTAGIDSYFLQAKAESFVYIYGSVASTIILIYLMVLAAGSFADEMKNGTIKLLLLRPITRSQLTTAKLLALYSWGAVLMAATYLVSFAYGAARYGSASGDKLLMVFNATNPFITTRGTETLINFVGSLIQIFSVLTFTFAVGTICKKKTIGIICGLVVSLGLFSLVARYLHIERFLLSGVINLSGYFNVASSMHGQNFFIAMPLLIVYMAVMLAGTYVVMNKRDVV